MNNKDFNHFQKTLFKLRNYTSSSRYVISVYLEINKKDGMQLAKAFHDMLRKTITEEKDHEIKDIVDAIDAYLKEENLHNNTYSQIVIFAGENMWEVIHHDFFLPALVSVSHVPYLGPLLFENARHANNLVIVADKEKADLFLINNGIVESVEHIVDATVPQKVKSNKEDYYARNNIILRHIQEHMHRHLQKIAQKITQFISNKPITAVFIGGHKQYFSLIKKHLSSDLQRKIAGEFVTELNISHEEILHHAQQSIEKYYFNAQTNFA